MEHKEPLLQQYEERDVLTRQQINQAVMDIQDIHPLMTRTKFEHIVPAFKCLRKCKKRKPDFQHSLRTSILKKLDIKMPKSDIALIEEPFLILGYGVNAYFDIMVNLSIMFIVITLFLTPIFYAYSQNAEQALSDQPKYFFNQFSLGNMGGASSLCAQKRVGTDSITLNCPSGVMIVGESLQFGMMSERTGMMTHCLESSIWKSEDNTKIANCTASMNRELFQ